MNNTNKTNEEIAEKLAQEQLDAYNNGNIEAFLKPYTKDCEIFDQASGKMMMKGHTEMRERYSKLFKTYPKLHADVTKRMSLGNFVIDYEEVDRSENEHVRAIAIYEIKDNLINKVWFIK